MKESVTTWGDCGFSRILVVKQRLGALPSSALYEWLNLAVGSIGII